MNKKKIQIILSLFLIALFPLTTTLTFQAAGSQSSILFPNITTSGVGNFVEDFTTDGFKDPASTAWGWGTGTVTNARDFTWTFLDYYNTPFPVRSLEVQGRKAYYVCLNKISTDYSVNAMNIIDPSNLRFMSKRDSLGDALTCAVDGDVLYTGRDQSAITQTFNTYNVSNPYDLDGSGIYLNYISHSGAVTDIDPEGHLVYYTTYNSTDHRSFHIADAQDPDNLRQITPNWDNNQSLGLEVEGHLAYIAASMEGFYVLNVSDKWSPLELDWIDTPGNATDVLIEGGFAYVADGFAGVTVIDIRNPANLAIIGGYNTPGYAHRLELQGKTLFVADGTGGVIVLDIADPYNPSFVTEMSPLPYVWDLDLYAGYLIVATDGGIYSYQICAGEGLTYFSGGVYENAFDGFQAWDVRVIGDIAYVVGGTDGFYTLNVRDPSNPVLLDHVPVTGIARKLDVKGQFAYVLGYSSFYIFDIRDPTNIKQMYEYLFMFDCIDSFVHGDILYFSWSHGGFGSFNISQPSSFSIPADIFPDTIYGSGINITAIWAQGPHVYSVASDFLAGIFAHETRNPYNNKYTDDYLGTPGYFYDIYVDGDIAYTAENQYIITFNVSNPYNIGLGTGLYNATGGKLGVWGFGPYIFSAESNVGVKIINATQINALKELAVVPEVSGAIQITTHGDYTYVANRSSLVILRHFESAADTYNQGTTFAQSTKVSEDPRRLITSATLHKEDFVPFGTNIDYFLSADGGLHWELVTPGTPHTFINSGYDLQWKAEITGPRDRSVHLYQIIIDYDFNLAPTEPILTDPGDTNFLGSVSLKWNESTDADGTIDHYEVEVSDSASFSTIIKEYNTTKTKQTVYPLKPGTYYFRVCAVDDGDAFSDWSTADIEVTFNLLGPMWLGIIGGGLIVLIALIVIISVVVRRKKKIPTR